MAKKREYKYYPDDFGALPVKALHMKLDFDVFEDHTVVTSDFTMKVKKGPLSVLALDAKNLEIQEVYFFDDPEGKTSKHHLHHTYEKEKDKLFLHFPEKLRLGRVFTIRTKTLCCPTANILEGLYYDETPKGKPKTMITQCQQWGFQRLVPCLDDMTAKCIYTTTITADSRYTSIITNGDLVSSKELGNGRKQVVYHNHKTPMAPYLFFLGVGTYATFKRPCTYPDGSSFTLELLLPPGTKPELASRALDILNDSILWVHVFTGKEPYKDYEKREELMHLLRQRDSTPPKDKQYAGILQRLKDLAGELTLGYAYTGSVYREIGMQNSDFGGMENVGNTTIITNRIVPFPEMSDPAFEYLIAVKVHEFFHNINGSEVTGASPFEIWLNEAVTVFIEQKYTDYLFGEDYKRIQTIMHLYTPMIGTFAGDLSPNSMPILPEGFNNPNELISGVTYVKAPEMVRMLEATMGKEAFMAGLSGYFEKFSHSNATTLDWIEAMEKQTGQHYKEFLMHWLTTTGFPVLHVTTEYKKGICTLSLVQEGKAIPWQFPLTLSLVDEHGKDIHSTGKTFFIKKQKETIRIPTPAAPAFVSLARDHSFYGKTVNHSATREQLMLQALVDPNIPARFMAFKELVEQEKIKIITNPRKTIDPSLISLFGKVLLDPTLDPGIKAMMLIIEESVKDDSLSHKYKEIYIAKEAIKKGIAYYYQKELLAIYSALGKSQTQKSYMGQMISDIKQRKLKNVCLSFLSSLDTRQIHQLIRKQLTSPSATDRYSAFSLFLTTSAPDKTKLAQKLRGEYARHHVSWESYLGIVSGAECDEVYTLITEAEKDERYCAEQATEQRALYMPFAMNRKRSVLTGKGLGFLTDTIIKLTKINEMSGHRMLSAFNQLHLLDPADQVRVVGKLLAIKDELPEKEFPSVHNNVLRILKNCPTAIASYEKGHRKQVKL